MTFALSHACPPPAFWERYTGLWNSSFHPSVFQSPGILCYHSTFHPDEVTVFTAEAGVELVAAMLFHRKGHVLTFLSDLKTDANHFILHRRLDNDAIRACFDGLLREVAGQNLALELNHKGGWAPYVELFQERLAASGLYHHTIDQSACPVAAADSPEELHARVTGSRNTRYKVNKFLKQPGAGFETLEDDRDMASWVEDFCATHVARWSTTSTPSAYRSEERRAFLLGCLEAWQKEGRLVRFAMLAAGKRVGQVVGLREGHVLFYHSPTFHPDFAGNSPGRVLIHHISGWMAANGFRELDFGYGREEYKYQFANTERPVLRIFAAPRSHVPFILRAQGIGLVRGYRRVTGLYLTKLKPLLRRWRTRTT